MYTIFAHGWVLTKIIGDFFCWILTNLHSFRSPSDTYWLCYSITQILFTLRPWECLAQTLKPIYSIHIGRRAYCIHMLESLSGVSNSDTINNTDIYRHISLQSFSSCDNFWPRLTTLSIRISTALGKHFSLDVLFLWQNCQCSLFNALRAEGS